MSIMATTFFSPVFAASYYYKSEFYDAASDHFHLNNSQKFFWLPAQCLSTFYSLRINAIFLVNARKSLKFNRFSQYRI